VHGRERSAGQAGTGVGLVGMALECAMDAAQLARVVGMPAMDAVSDQDAPAANLEQVGGPSDDGEAAADRGIDQHECANSSLTIGKCGIFKI